jgi:hypothetical protein
MLCKCCTTCNGVRPTKRPHELPRSTSCHALYIIYRKRPCSEGHGATDYEFNRMAVREALQYRMRELGMESMYR